ncbi:hypothetical protein XAC3615_13150003 [Xanthomonas citri pv. citri]|nr:hypothetical protein XAC3615_13150003 [Xanthomonas citri pv. citri]
MPGPRIAPITRYSSSRSGARVIAFVGSVSSIDWAPSVRLIPTSWMLRRSPTCALKNQFSSKVNTEPKGTSMSLLSTNALALIVMSVAPLAVAGFKMCCSKARRTRLASSSFIDLTMNFFVFLDILPDRRGSPVYQGESTWQVDTRLVASIKMIAKINITASRTLAARVLTASDGS